MDTLIDRTTKTQKELVEKEFLIGDLMQHLINCIKAARDHYVLYKIVDWAQDLFAHNTMPEHRRAVIETDFSASPNLSASRTATGAAETHAVLAIYISRVYDRNEDGSVKVTKRSHCYIGGSESAGKKNTWMFHNACLDHLIGVLQDERSEPLLEVVVMTDRCPGQYLCRQNMLHEVAIYSSVDGNPIVKHVWAVRYRFKGLHDAEGKVLKEAVERAVKGGQRGGTAWCFFATTKKVCTYSKDKEEVATNQLDGRDIYYVVYTQGNFDLRNTGEHEGSIILADMNVLQDTAPIRDTTSIYMARGFPKEFVPPPADESERIEEVKAALEEIERPNNEISDNAFLANIAQLVEGEMTEQQEARRDFIEVERGDLNANELMTQLGGKKAGYFEEFLSRAGKEEVPRSKRARVNNIVKWLEAGPAVRLSILRSGKQLRSLHSKMCPWSNLSANTTKDEMMSDILGVVSTLPDTQADLDFRGEHYHLKKTNMPCGCKGCLSGGACESPFKKYFTEKYEKMEVINISPIVAQADLEADY